MDAGKRDVTTIFNKARSLQIPFFQRAYVWERENWERFADDLITVPLRRTDYFLGSIILKQKPTSAGDSVGDVRAVIDGQQRLTSLVLFFRVLCDSAHKPDLFKQIFFNLANELTLQHNHNDIKIFEALAIGDELTPALRAEFDGNKVLGAYEYFRSRSSEIGAIDPLILIGRLYFVGIDLAADEDEQQIFDTINSLGVDLTTAELLKNELFGRSDVAMYERTWRVTFEANEEARWYWSRPVTSGRERRQNIDLFLQSYLLNHPNALEDVRVGDLFNAYKRLVAHGSVNKVSFAEDLGSAAETYRDNVDPDITQQAMDPHDPVARLNLTVFALQTTTVLPYMLYLLRSVPDRNESARLLRLVESYLMRRLVAGGTSKHYNRFFASLARTGVGSYEGLVERLTRADDPTTAFPTDDKLRTGFQSTNLTNAQGKVVLYLIEASIRNEQRHSTALASFNHYTLEHVMPKKWHNHWGSVSPEIANRRYELLRKLGNFTLLSAQLNTSIRDSPWPIKKSGSGANAGLLRYGQGLDIFDEYLQLDEWTEEHIIARGHELADRAIAIWPHPKPNAWGSDPGLHSTAE
jgi:hypothetical protein